MKVLVVALLAGVVGTTAAPARDALARDPVIVVLEGVPGDSVAAEAFRQGFRKAFAAGALETARAKGARAGVVLPIPNRFRLIEPAAGAEPPPDAWRAQLSLEWPAPPKRARTPVAPSRARVRCTWFALSPQAIAAGARVMPRKEQLTFADGTPRAEMGRLLGVLLLESLHQLDGALAEERRLFLGATRRQPF